MSDLYTHLLSEADREAADAMDAVPGAAEVVAVMAGMATPETQMIDATNIAPKKGFEAEGPKPTVSNTSSAWRLRCAPTLTPSAPLFIAQPMIFCQSPRQTPRRETSDAEIVTLAVAQVLMGLPSDRRFLRAACRQSVHLFPDLPAQDAFHKRRVRLQGAIE